MEEREMRRVTFVLPHGGAAGGVRVTVEMAMQLKKRGYGVRIVWPAQPLLSKETVVGRARLMVRRLQGSNHFDWLHHFNGTKETFVALGDLAFAKGEIVIAVGERTVKDVYELKKDVFKLRYCHCLFDHLPELNKTAWGVPMPTICVSPSLVPRLEAYSGGKVLAVVPNGINGSEYYIEPRDRDGIGLIYRNIPHKGPEVAKTLVSAARTIFPQVPWHMFGVSRRPRQFARHQYCQYPAVAKARELYNRCKVWLVTSRDEGFCLPILEAMACGCVVISSNHQVASDIIQDGHNGFIVPYGDNEAYLQKIQLLLDNESERRRMVEESLNTLRDFTWKRAVADMELVFETVISGDVSPKELAAYSR
jgi:glycosyltransferase involved in cell wall biosynthesis